DGHSVRGRLPAQLLGVVLRQSLLVVEVRGTAEFDAAVPPPSHPEARVRLTGVEVAAGVAPRGVLLHRRGQGDPHPRVRQPRRLVAPPGRGGLDDRGGAPGPPHRRGPAPRRGGRLRGRGAGPLPGDARPPAPDRAPRPRACGGPPRRSRERGPPRAGASPRGAASPSRRGCPSGPSSLGRRAGPHAGPAAPPSTAGGEGAEKLSRTGIP